MKLFLLQDKEGNSCMHFDDDAASAAKHVMEVGFHEKIVSVIDIPESVKIDSEILHVADVVRTLIHLSNSTSETGQLQTILEHVALLAWKDGKASAKSRK